MTSDVFSSLEGRAIVEYRVETVSDLHIGSHGTTEPASVDLPVIKDLEGIPYIPGSSLKGVLRTEIERLLRSLGEIDGKNPRSCEPDPKLMCGEGEECTACILFGGLSLAASVKVHDATTTSKKNLIRDGVRIDRKTGKAASGAKYDLEVVPRGTVFYGRMMVENPDLAVYDIEKKDEKIVSWKRIADGSFKMGKLGALLSTIQFFNATSRRLGGSTSRGYGEVLIIPTAVRMFTADDYLEGRMDGTLIEGIEETENNFKMKDDLFRATDQWRNYLKTFDRPTIVNK